MDVTPKYDEKFSEDTITIPKFYDFLQTIDINPSVVVQQLFINGYKYGGQLLPTAYGCKGASGPTGPTGAVGASRGSIINHPDNIPKTPPREAKDTMLVFRCTVDGKPDVKDLLRKLKLTPPIGKPHTYDAFECKAVIGTNIQERKIGYYKTPIYDAVAAIKQNIHPDYTWKDIVKYEGDEYDGIDGYLSDDVHLPGVGVGKLPTYDSDLVTREQYKGEQDLLWSFRVVVNVDVPTGEYRVTVRIFHDDLDNNIQGLKEILRKTGIIQ